MKFWIYKFYMKFWIYKFYRKFWIDKFYMKFWIYKFYRKFWIYKYIFFNFVFFNFVSRLTEKTFCEIGFCSILCNCTEDEQRVRKLCNKIYILNYKCLIFFLVQIVNRNLRNLIFYIFFWRIESCVRDHTNFAKNRICFSISIL